MSLAPVYDQLVLSLVQFRVTITWNNNAYKSIFPCFYVFIVVTSTFYDAIPETNAHSTLSSL